MVRASAFKLDKKTGRWKRRRPDECEDDAQTPEPSYERQIQQRRLERHPEIVRPDVITCTDSFNQYYDAQGIIPDPEEWERFVECLHQPLPVSFRTNRMPAYKRMMTHAMRDGSNYLTFAGLQAKELQWADAWQLCGVDALALAKRESPELKQLGTWLDTYTDAGLFSLQDIASILPALLLDVQPHHACLDICAAPGFQTTQLLEAVHRQGGHKATGCVVANDFTRQRARILPRRHRQRLGTYSHLMVVNHRPQTLPWFSRPPPASPASPPLGVFDRILCDVPCSGDGAIRTTPELWRRWQPHQGLHHHSLQLQIAMRAASLLQTGGLMTYSTRSLNPIENEAVVCSLLARGALELVDCSQLVPALARAPGLSSWTVMDDLLEPLPSFRSTQRKRVPRRIARRFTPSMWPPPRGECPPLHRCLRLYPHLQNTGGLFVALLRKIKPIPSGREQPRASQANPDHTRASPQAGEAPRTLEQAAYARVPSEVLQTALVALGLDPEARARFHAELGPHVFARNQGRAPRLVYVAPSVQELFLQQAGPQAGPLHTTFAGMQVLHCERGRWRLCHEGLAVVVPFLPDARKLWLPGAQLLSFLRARDPAKASAGLDADKLWALPAGYAVLCSGPYAVVCEKAWQAAAEAGEQDSDGQRQGDGEVTPVLQPRARGEELQFVICALEATAES